MAMFDREETARLRALFGTFTQPVECRLYQTGGNAFGRKLEECVREICRLSEGKCITIEDETGGEPAVIPCFSVGAGRDSHIAWAALPTEHQFRPFLNILERIGRGEPETAEKVSGRGSSPAELVVLISDSCPRCPLVVEAAGAAALEGPAVSAFFVDAMQFQNFVKEYRIRSVPATILDRQIVLIGAVTAERITELVRSRGTPEFERVRVLSLVERQDVAGAARHLGRDAGRDVVLDLLRDADFSKRLSALVILEKGLEDDPDTVRAMVPFLTPMLSHTDARIRGDVADLLGKIGDPGAIAHLQPLLSDPDPDVAEAAADALAELEGS